MHSVRYELNRTAILQPNARNMWSWPQNTATLTEVPPLMDAAI